jgi:hypothetical protein
MNSIMKRAADVLRIDEALFRYRNPGEHPEMPTRIPINEDLQIVHYGQGQQYTAHTDHVRRILVDVVHGMHQETLTAHDFCSSSF